MDKKGQTLGLGILSALVIFIIGILMINFLMTEVTTARTDLNCANAGDITDGTKVLCLMFDTTIPYWIWLIFSVVIGVVIARTNI